MGLTEKQTRLLIFSTQSVGCVFVGIFLMAYLLGLPSTNVLHMEPYFRIPLVLFGFIFLALSVISCFLGICRKNK